MFGYLDRPCGCVSLDSCATYRAHFCGLRNVQRQTYGLPARFLVNRDSAFIALLRMRRLK